MADNSAQVAKLRTLYGIMNSVEVRLLIEAEDLASFGAPHAVSSAGCFCILLQLSPARSKTAPGLLPSSRPLIPPQSPPTLLQNNLGGGEGVEGLYGSITGSFMQRILSCMRQHCGLGPDSHLLDVGAGLGRPLLHALFTEGVGAASGLELDAVKCMKAEAFDGHHEVEHGH